MVAESETLTPKPIRRVSSIPIATRLRAQNLYINQGRSPAEIGPAVGLTPQQVHQLAVNGHWTKVRNARLAAISKRVETRTQAGISAVEETICSEADELSLSSLQRTRGALDDKGPTAAKDAQAFSATLRNLVTVSRAIRGADNQLGENAGTLNVSLFFMREAQPEKRADVVDVVASAVVSTSPTLTK